MVNLPDNAKLNSDGEMWLSGNRRDRAHSTRAATTDTAAGRVGSARLRRRPGDRSVLLRKYRQGSLGAWDCRRLQGDRYVSQSRNLRNSPCGAIAGGAGVPEADHRRRSSAAKTAGSTASLSPSHGQNLVFSVAEAQKPPAELIRFATVRQCNEHQSDARKTKHQDELKLKDTGGMWRHRTLSFCGNASLCRRHGSNSLQSWKESLIRLTRKARTTNTYGTLNQLLQWSGYRNFFSYGCEDHLRNSKRFDESY